MEPKVIFMNGFTPEEALAAMRAIKAALPAARDAAFATATETNLTWKVSELVRHVSEEHRAMTGQGARKA